VTRLRAAVLASGGGSNLQALLDHLAVLGDTRALDVVLVASDRAQAGALERAQRAGITTALVQSRSRPQATALEHLLESHEVEYVVLAGYLRLVPAPVTQRFAWRMINVHPGPLPRFGGPGMYGAHVHRAVLAAGADRTGPTVHLVDEVYDHGAQLAHWPVPVIPGDDEQRLAARVLRAEHLLFPRMVNDWAEAIPQLRDRDSTTLDVSSPQTLPLFDPELDDATLAARLDTALAG